MEDNFLFFNYLKKNSSPKLNTEKLVTIEIMSMLI